MKKVALCSFLFQGNRLKDFQSISHAVEHAAKQHCNLICFPECALSGLPTGNYKKDLKLAVKIPGKVTQKIGILARAHKIYVAIGLLESTGKKIYDSAVLISDQGEIVLKYRRINSQWHSRGVTKSIYREGQTLKATKTPFGRVAFALCGDIFDKTVIRLIKKAKPDYLIIPMSRSFNDNSYDQKRWDKEEMKAYTAQVRTIGVTSFLINAFERRDRGAAFGGCFVITAKGQIIAKTKIGKPIILIYRIRKSPF
ncbi:MAG: carbon-nitrogen hydrolase family protein [Candidatus Helarchaeota archaeon]